MHENYTERRRAALGDQFLIKSTSYLGATGDKPKFG
jgi:hypothetical protein